jgi:hypothetical protein
MRTRNGAAARCRSTDKGNMGTPNNQVGDARIVARARQVAESRRGGPDTENLEEEGKLNAGQQPVGRPQHDPGSTANRNKMHKATPQASPL